MATGGKEKAAYSLVNVGDLRLEDTNDDLYYRGIVACRDKIIVIDSSVHQVQLHRLQDGKLLCTHRLESTPRAICVINDMEIAVILDDGQIQIMAVESRDKMATITSTRNLQVQGGFDRYDGVVKFKKNLVVCGVKQETISWFVVSLNDGRRVDTIHQICKVDEYYFDYISYLTTKDNIIYISCFAGFNSPDNGVYGFDILNPSQPKYRYKYEDLSVPGSIAINQYGFIFVCNFGLNSCIHQLTSKCQLVSINRLGIPGPLSAIFWDHSHGHLYVTCKWSNVMTIFQPECPDPVIPVEILRMDDESIQLYKKALQDGMEKVYNIRVMVVGQYGVGKTTLTKHLLGQQVDISERKSTEGIDVYKHCCKISLDTGEWIVQLEDADHLSRLQRLMKLLSGPDKKPGVSQEQEYHIEVIYQREAASEVDISQPTALPIIKVDGRHGVAHSDQKTSTVAFPLSEAESSENEKKKDAVMEILHLINENSNKLEKDIVKYAALSIWDFAGQYAFYSTHQTFLTRCAIYLLLIDLNQQVTDLIKDDKCFLDMEGIKLCKVHDLVEIWLNSIHSCAPSPEASLPNVILVGTHVDKLSEESRKEVIDKYFKKLRYILKDKPTIRHLMDDIAIDNTQRDPVLEELKKRIFELASQQPHWGEEKPARWLPLEQAIMTLKASGAKVVALSLIEEINRSGSVRIEERDELDLFLKFHHEMGTILYFSVEGLREKIVLDPQWLIDALKSLITAETFIKKNSAITSKWYEFKETGKLTHELIDAIWTRENNPEFYENKEHVLLVMEKLNIIAKPISYIEDSEEFKEENYFLAPCMLQQKTPEEVICPKPNDQMESSSVLSYVFIDKFLPSPIFHRLLAACVAHWPIARKKKEDMQENMIFCGCCIFQLDQYHKLTLHFREYVIFLRVTRMGIKDKTPSSKLCIEVREFVTTMLLKIIGYLGQSLKFEHFIQCPEYIGVSINSLIPVSLLKENAEVHCEFHDNIIESCKLLKFWFKGQQQQEVEHRQLSGSDEDQEEEGQDNADTPITQEHINHARLCNALTTVCADALREILINQVPIPYADIYQAILANEANLTRKLNNDQSDVVFPDTPGITGTVEQFDTSLLYTIIRNISSVPAPTTGWGNPPIDQPRDTSLGASVERIRFYRNKVSGHSVDGKISETEFKDYWQQIDDVLHDIESAIGVQGYRVQLEKRKSQAITPHEARQLQRQFQEYKKQVEDAKEKLRIAMDAVERLLI